MVNKSFMRYLIAIFIILTSAYQCFAADPFTVAGVPVDATGNTAIEAQTNAIQDGQLRAANILIDRLTLTGTAVPELELETAAKMIRGLEIANEKRSANRYLGDITVAFNPSRIQQYLQSQDLTMIATQARERIVLPVFGGTPLWTPNEWMMAWETGGFSHALTPVKAPVGGSDALITAAEVSAIDMAALRSAGQALGTEQILVAAADNFGGTISVRLIDIALDTGLRRDLGQISGNSFAQAAEISVDRLESDWKQASVAVTQSAVSIPVSILYNSLAEWQNLQDVINGSSQIQAARLDALSKDGALMTLTYGGDIERLRRELSFKGVEIKNDAKLGTVLAKTGRL